MRYLPIRMDARRARALQRAGTRSAPRETLTTAIPVRPPERGTFREAYRRLTATGFQPSVVAGILIRWRLRLTQGQLPENRPPAEREAFDDVETKLREIFREAPYELREAGFVPGLLVPEGLAWQRFLEVFGAWMQWFDRDVRRTQDPGKVPDPAVEEARALWSHAIHCAESAGIIHSRTCLRRFRKGLFRAKGVRLSPEDVNAEWQLITRSPHRTLFRWKCGRLELSDWRVRDATPDRAPRRRARKPRPEGLRAARRGQALLRPEIDGERFVRDLRAQREAWDGSPALQAALEYVLADLRYVGDRLVRRMRLRRHRLGDSGRQRALAVADALGGDAVARRESRASVATRYGVSVKALRYREPSVYRTLDRWVLRATRISGQI